MERKANCWVELQRSFRTEVGPCTYSERLLANVLFFNTSSKPTSSNLWRKITSSNLWDLADKKARLLGNYWMISMNFSPEKELAIVLWKQKAEETRTCTVIGEDG